MNEVTHTERELNHCPVCKSDDIHYVGHFEHGVQQVSCDACTAVWQELWEYSGVVLVEVSA